MKPGSSFIWACPDCGGGSRIDAEVNMTLDEATGIIAHKHHSASPNCKSWEKIKTLNVKNCPYFGPALITDESQPDPATERDHRRDTGGPDRLPGPAARRDLGRQLPGRVPSRFRPGPKRKR